MRELLLTIHGIHNNGAWQTTVAEVLEPHFDCQPLRYRGYLLAGSLVLTGPLIGMTVLPVVVVLYLLGKLPLPWVIGLALASLTLAVAGWLAPVVTRYRIRREIAKARRPYLTPPHLIAHSFGTHLCCWALNNYEAVRFGHVILVGSVLPRTFPWEKNRSSFESVRNEVGLRDWVVVLVRLLRLVRPSFGVSGGSGFAGDAAMVHDQEGSWRLCESCGSSEKAPVHNVRHDGDHWIELMTGDHPQDIWLPILWGHQPGHYSEYLKLCYKGHRALKDDRWHEAGQVQRDFASRTWGWTAGQRSDEFLQTLLETHLMESNKDRQDLDKKRAIAQIVYDIWFGLIAAKAESLKARGERTDKVVRYMRPEWLYEETVRKFVERI